MLKPGESYSGRRADVVVINASLSAEAIEVLRLYCPPGRKALGKFIERLVFAHHARQEERKHIIDGIVSRN